MIKCVRDLSIKGKLLLILFVSSFTALTFASLLLLFLELSEFKKNTKDDLSAMALIIGNRSTAALIFDDHELAQENLSVLNNLPVFRLACIYSKQGEIFTQLSSSQYSGSNCPASSLGEKTRFEERQLLVFQKIILDAEEIGVVHIHADLTDAIWRKLQFLGVISIVLLTVSVFTFFLATPLLGLISVPIKKLLDTVLKITHEQDYSLRVKRVNNDELGILVDEFNSMIGTVEEQNQALVMAKNRYLALYDDNPTLLFNLDRDGIIVSVNRYGARQLGQTTEELQQCSVYDFIHPEDLALTKALFGQCFSLPNSVHKQEIRMIRDNGRMIWVRGTARLMENYDQQGNILLVCEDVTETRLLSEKIAYQASHDALTNLVNRAEFDNYVQQALESAQTNQTEHALCYLDLDQFKVVNDTCGHLAGDELLRQLGSLLRKHIRRDDILARLGGDEFGILMSHNSLSEAFSACEQIRNVVRDFCFAWQDRSFTVGVSIGISSINETSGKAEDVLKEADAACYAAKEKGRNRVHIFRPDDEELLQRQGEMQWVEKIYQGLNDDRFSLYGQIIVPISGQDKGMHFETLIRYQDQLGNIIPPGAFLPAAERYNLAPMLDRWVIATLFKWMAKKPDFLENLSLCSVNLSGLSLSDETMLEFIYGQFSQWKIPTEKICFEITETAAIANLSNAMNFIQQLKNYGSCFSLDDFGSGLSSFAYLKNLPVDYLKIDGLFVKDILDDKVDLAMVRSINEVGHVMNKQTIAEFVENRQIYEVLKGLGVDYAQGYGIGKPVPLDELELTGIWLNEKEQS